jgi:hypothetical protein
VNSPDAFDRRIEEAARALRGSAPLPFEAVRAAARDADAAIDAAARATAPHAPAWESLRERLADPDAALDAAARAATPPAPALPFETLWTRSRRLSLVRRRLGLRALIAAAASIVVGALVLHELPRRGRPAPEAPTTLLTTAQLVQAERAESRLQSEADELAQRVAGRGNASEDGQALSEELAFLESALGECRAALEENELHPQLRRQLTELTSRRLELLRRLDALPSGPGAGDGRG